MRYAYIDNAKSLLLVFVIFGHLLESLISEFAIARILYFAIYLFHIPAFAYLSGVVVRRGESIVEWWRRNRALLITFVVFEALYESVHFVLAGQPSQYVANGQPYWLLWYLWSLILWRLTLVLLSPNWTLLAAALSAACCVALLPDSLLVAGLARTVVFYPFFVLGAVIGAKVETLGEKSITRPICTALVALTIPVAFLCLPASVEWLYGSRSFEHLRVGAEAGMIFRAGLIAFSALAAVSFCLAVPRTTTPLGAASVNSLYAYVWHGFVVKLLEHLEIPLRFAKLSEVAYVTAALLVSLVLFLLLSSKWIARFTTEVLIEPLSKPFRPATGNR